MQFLFMSALYTSIGIPLANTFLPFLFRVIGIRATLLLGSLIFFFNCATYVLSMSLFWLSFSAFICGISYQFIKLSTNIFFFDKYPANAQYFVGISIAGNMVGCFLMTFLMSKVINPNNVEMADYVNKEGNTVLLFPLEIAERVKTHLFLEGLFCIVITILCVFFIKPSDKYKGSVFVWLFNRDSEDIVVIDSKGIENDKEMLNSSILSQYSLNKEKEEDLEEELVDKEKVPEIKEKKSELKTKKFWYNYVVSILRFSVLAYYLDNFKVIGLVKIHDDVFINKIWAAALASGVFGNLIAPVIWRYFGFINTYMVSNSSKLLFILILLFFGGNKYVYGLFGMFTRSSISADMVYSYFSLFELYDNDTVLKLAGVYDTHMTTAFLLAIIMNYTLVWNNNYDYIACVYAVLSGLAMFLTYLIKLEL